MTGGPTLVAGRLYVPLSSLEESGAGNPNYPCCTFRGGVIAYDALNGRRLWTAYTIPEEPVQLKKTSRGVQLWGPAGAGVWSSPTVDLKRRAVYVATGNAYTQPAANTSDAVIAFDLDTGARRWVRQVMAGDAYVRDCPGKYRPLVPKDNKSETCPDDLGPDMDFGNAPILRTLPDGRTLIVIGQKDGHAWALDPDRDGAIVWSRQVGYGIDNGGGAIMWGSAADDRLGYFPVTRATPTLGVAALRLADGALAWRAAPADGGAAPASVMPGVLFFGSSAGTVYAYSTTDGRALWQFETAREFDTVNGVRAQGGTINAAGPVVAAGMLFVPSGYSELGIGVRGNVLLAFAVRRTLDRCADIRSALSSSQRTPRTRRSKQLDSFVSLVSSVVTRRSNRLPATEKRPLATPRALVDARRAAAQRRADERPLLSMHDSADAGACRGGTADDQRALLPRSMPPLGAIACGPVGCGAVSGAGAVDASHGLAANERVPDDGALTGSAGHHRRTRERLTPACQSHDAGRQPGHGLSHRVPPERSRGSSEVPSSVPNELHGKA